MEAVGFIMESVVYILRFKTSFNNSHLYFESEIPGVNEKIVRVSSWKTSLSYQRVFGLLPQNFNANSPLIL